MSTGIDGEKKYALDAHVWTAALGVALLGLSIYLFTAIDGVASSSSAAYEKLAAEAGASREALHGLQQEVADLRQAVESLKSSAVNVTRTAAPEPAPNSAAEPAGMSHEGAAQKAKRHK